MSKFWKNIRNRGSSKGNGGAKDRDSHEVKIPFEDIFTTKSEAKSIKDAQDKLQLAIHKLQAVLKEQKITPEPGGNRRVEPGVQASTNEEYERLLKDIIETESQDVNSARHKAKAFMLTVLPVAKFVFGTLSIGSSAAGVIPLTIVANSLTQICTVKLVEEISKEDELAATQKMTHIGDIESSIRSVAALDLDEMKLPGQSIMVNAIMLLEAMTEYLRTSIQYLRSSSLRKLKNKAFSNNVNVVEAEKKLNEAEQAFHKSCLHAASIESLATAAAQRRRDEKEELERLLSKIDHEQIHADQRQDRCQGTTDWIFIRQEYDDWWKSSDRILWCYGVPGVGKTHLASAVVDWVKDKANITPGIGLAYAYCRYDSKEDDQRAFSILKSLIRQFIECAPWKQREDLVKKAKELLQKLGPGKPENWERDFMKSIISLSQFARAIVVIDALDECPAELAGGVTNRDLLISWLRLIPNLSIFITSRNTPAIEQALQGVPNFAIKPPWEAIELYINKLIADRSKLSTIITANRELRDGIDSAVKSEFGDPLFITARLLINFISPLRPGEIKDVLNMATSTSSTHMIDGEPGGGARAHLSSSEPEFWYSILIQRVKDKHPQGAQVIAWVLCARRKMMVEELRHAIAFVKPSANPTTGLFAFKENRPLKGLTDFLPSQEDLLEECAGIVEMKHGEVSFAHSTIPEYLQTKENVLGFCPHTLLARSCVRYLKAPDFDEGFCFTNADLESRLRKYPLYAYASQNWGIHSLQASTTIIEIEEFLRSKRKVEASSQALMVPRSQYGYNSQNVPRTISGLHLAAYFGIQTAVETLLGELDPNAKDTYDRTPLIYAAMNGHQHIMNLMLDSGRVHAEQPLWYAIEHDQGLVATLLNTGRVTVNERYRHHGTPLYYAAQHGNKRLVEVLIDRGNADVNWSNPDNHMTPLAVAAENNHADVVNVLLKVGSIDADARDKLDETPLFYAARNGHQDVVRLLLEKSGVDINANNRVGEAPISVAVRGNHVEVVELLWATRRLNREVVDSLKPPDGCDQRILALLMQN